MLNWLKRKLIKKEVKQSLPIRRAPIARVYSTSPTTEQLKRPYQSDDNTGYGFRYATPDIGSITDDSIRTSAMPTVEGLMSVIEQSPATVFGGGDSGGAGAIDSWTSSSDSSPSGYDSGSSPSSSYDSGSS